MAPLIQNLAPWLLAHEQCEVKSLLTPARPVFCVCEKLRKPLSMLGGADGYKALISRALLLAKAEVPSLGSVRVLEDGSLEASGSEADGAEGDAALVAQLLGLLATFIGEALTMQLVRDAWPDAPFDSIGSERERP